MSSIREIEVKGWSRDGVENWTVGIVMDLDGLQPELPQHAIDTMLRSVESAKAAIRQAIAPAVKTDFKGEPYDATDKRWNCCPTCGSTAINKTSKTGRAYQACYECKVFLEADGKVKEMRRE